MEEIEGGQVKWLLHRSLITREPLDKLSRVLSGVQGSRLGKKLTFDVFDRGKDVKGITKVNAKENKGLFRDANTNHTSNAGLPELPCEKK